MTTHTTESLTLGANLGGETPALLTVKELLGRLSSGDLQSATLFSPVVASEETTRIDNLNLGEEEKFDTVKVVEPILDHEHISVVGLASVFAAFKDAGVVIDSEKGIVGQTSKRDKQVRDKPMRFGNDEFDRLTGESPLLDGLSVAVRALLRRKQFGSVSMHFILKDNPFELALKPNEADRNNATSMSARLIRDLPNSQ